ncbi:MAG TPA: hypothetical protein VF815_38500 [Myxococcaceae bacterium]|jgi:hypothetical protein
MGIFTDRQVTYVDDIRIEVLGTITLFGGKFQLLVAGQQVDEAPCTIGKSVTLRTRLKRDDAEKQVEVVISQGWMGTRFRFFVDGTPHRLHQVY